MTPQAFSYPIVANNGMIYIPPFGLTESIDYMLKFNPKDETFTRIKLDVSDCTEKWIWGTAWRNKIIVLPYNEDNILIIDTDDDSVEYSEVEKGKGKYIQGHIHGDNLFALPYGEHEPYDYVLNLALPYMYPDQEKLKLPTNDCKKWHTTQIIDGIIYGLPRGESLDNSFNYRIEFDCSNEEYELTDMLPEWEDYEHDGFNNKKYTTMAKVGNRLYAPPYSENPNFDVLTKFVDGKWITERTGIKGTSRTYFAHSVASNGKIFCPPAGHEETWSEMLVIDPSADNGHDTYWHTINLGIGKESKKFCVIGMFADPERLSEIRKTRANTNQNIDLNLYTNVERIKEEVENSKKMFKKFNWPTIDVTRRSVEETAASIVKIYEIKKNK